MLFFFNAPATTEIYTLSLHDALPISAARLCVSCRPSFRSGAGPPRPSRDRKSTRLNSSHVSISYAVFCLKKKNKLEAILGALAVLRSLRTQLCNHLLLLAAYAHRGNS